MVILDKKAYSKLKKCFESSSEEIKQLCEKNQSSGELLNNEQVCHLLDISKRTLQHYRDIDLLPCTKIGNKCFYKKSDINMLIEKSTKKSQ